MVACLRTFHPDNLFLQEMKVFEWWLNAKKQVPKSLQKGFDSLFFLIGWSLWKERNARTFDTASCSPV